MAELVAKRGAMRVAPGHFTRDGQEYARLVENQISGLIEGVSVSRKYTPAEIEALTNWDGLLAKPPWKNKIEMRQYYARYVDRLLWRYFSEEDWRNLAGIIDELRVDDKLKKTTCYLLEKRKEKKGE